jgi:hypothetical protein
MSTAQEAVKATDGLDISDPGAGGTITSRGCVGSRCVLTSATAESRTLGAPQRENETLLLTCRDQAAGDITLTITPTGLFDETGQSGALATLTTVVFSADGESLLLRCINVGGTLTWVLQTAMGAGLS